jgi:hypothetical protein
MAICIYRLGLDAGWSWGRTLQRIAGSRLRNATRTVHEDALRLHITLLHRHAAL